MIFILLQMRCNEKNSSLFFSLSFAHDKINSISPSSKIELIRYLMFSQPFYTHDALNIAYPTVNAIRLLHENHVYGNQFQKC